MDFHEREQAFNKKDLSEELVRLYNEGKKLNLSISEKKKVQKQIEEYASGLKFLPSINYIVLGLLYDREKTLDTIRRKGILRYSKYLNTKNFPAALSEKILSLSPGLSLNSYDKQYFESLLNLAPIYEVMRNLRSKIIGEIKLFSKRPKIAGFSPSIAKSLLAALDFLFMTDYYPLERETPDSIKFYVKEDIAEAVSYIIYLKQEVFGLNDSDSYVIDDEYIVSNEIEAILLPACHLKKIQEIEIMIDHFLYYCMRDKNKIRIGPAYPDLEKSIRIGYIRSDLQKSYDLKDFKDMVSLEGICDKFLQIPNFDVFKYVVNHDYPRYRIELPEPIFDKLSEDFFKSKTVFKEEAQYLSIIFKEQLLNFNKLNTIKISDNLSLYEFFILKRLFAFFYYIFMKKVEDKLQTDTKVILRSLIPTFTEEKLEKFYSGIVSKKAFNEFLNIVTWNPRSDSVFDIQYQPFVKLNSSYMIPVYTFVSSNSIRNVFASEYKMGNPKIMDNGEYDPISESLVKVFKKRGFKTFARIPHIYKQGGDIDFLAFKDDFLFIAECKKFLHPTTIYELRTIYDGLFKASSQLNLILQAIHDDRASKALALLIGADIKKFKHVKTSIVTNTRLFWGLSLKNHPVRNVFELFNFMETGQFRTEDGYYWLWVNDYFTLNDLERYLEEGSPAFKGFYNAMLPKDMKYEFGKYNITLETFILNLEKAKNIAKDMRFRKVV